MAYNYDPEYVERMKEMLMVIGRTNLMAPSKEEFGKMIDRDLSKNSVSKLKLLSDFSVCAIFHQLESIVEIETEGLIDLEEFLIRYKHTYTYYKEKLQGFLRNRNSDVMEKLYAILDYVIFTNTPLEEERNMTWDEQWEETLQNKVDLRLVVLLALGALPAYSGKGMAVAAPLEGIRTFIMDFVKREDCVLSYNSSYYTMLTSSKYALDDRIAAVAVMYKFCRIANLAYTMDLSRTVSANCVEIKGVDVDSNVSGKEMPVLWWNEKVEHEFWFFQFFGDAYYMVKCNTAKKEYTKYTMFPGSELGGCIGRVLHPKFITSLIEGDFTNCCTIFSWTAEYDRKGIAQRLEFCRMTPADKSDDWANEFRKLNLQRLSSSHRNYSYFCRFLIKDPLGWQLNNRVSNAYPGTSYVMSKSIYAVTLDHILVQDIEVNPDSTFGFDLIPDKYFKVDRDWIDYDVHLGDDIGILILGTDEPDKPMRKYLSFDYNCTYFPIINDEIIFPE